VLNKDAPTGSFKPKAPQVEVKMLEPEKLGREERKRNTQAFGVSPNNKLNFEINY
jgi:hypothetical protein